MGEYGSGLDTSTIGNCFNIFVDSNENLYVSDYDNNRVVRYPSNSSSGMPGVVVAGNGTSGTSASQLNGPRGVQILRWPPNSNSGECIVACTGISGVGIDMLYGPFALAFDSYGSLFISDGNINRVQKFQILSGFDETSTTTITITRHTTSLQASSKSNRTHSSTIAISIAVLLNAIGIESRHINRQESSLVYIIRKHFRDEPNECIGEHGNV
ncbi:unnamed protein product, partial [Rotaria sp. Silwood1]